MEQADSLASRCELQNRDALAVPLQGCFQPEFVVIRGDCDRSVIAALTLEFEPSRDYFLFDRVVAREPEHLIGDLSELRNAAQSPQFPLLFELGKLSVDVDV